MINKCHKAIIENAENQGKDKLLKLIRLAEDYKLKFVYAYKKHFEAYLGNPERIIKYIEVIDPYCKKNLFLNITIIKNEKEVTISITNRFKDQEAVNKFSVKEFKKYTERLLAAYNFSKELEKFDLNDLPYMN